MSGTMDAAGGAGWTLAAREAAARGLPKYTQLRDALLAAIQSGRFQPGAKLPTEQELVRATPFSLGTVQRALRALVEAGIVVRQQGSGTYVADTRKAMDAPWHCRFIADDGERFLPVYPRVLWRGRVRERGPWTRFLGAEVEAVRIDRVIAIADEFRVCSRFYVSAERFPGLEHAPLAELDGANLKALIARECGLAVVRLEQTLSTVRFPAAVRRALAPRAPAAGTLLEIAASAARGRPLYFQELYIPPNRRRLVVSDTLPGAANPATGTQR